MKIAAALFRSANVFHFVKGGKDFIVSANREIDEIALYEIDI